jgi:hypothetical protein
VAEIDPGHRPGVVGESEIWPRRIAFRADDDGVGPAGELAVGRSVVSVRMRVQNEQLVAVGMWMPGQPAVEPVGR